MDDELPSFAAAVKGFLALLLPPVLPLAVEEAASSVTSESNSSMQLLAAEDERPLRGGSDDVALCSGSDGGENIFNARS